MVTLLLRYIFARHLTLWIGISCLRFCISLGSTTYFVTRSWPFCALLVYLFLLMVMLWFFFRAKEVFVKGTRFPLSFFVLRRRFSVEPLKWSIALMLCSLCLTTGEFPYQHTFFMLMMFLFVVWAQGKILDVCLMFSCLFRGFRVDG